MPILAEGNDQWLGDGYYFWQDIEFSKWWGDERKKNISKRYSIYKATLVFDEENEFIDTVFNEEDYYNFVKKVEAFAKKYQKAIRRKPSLEEFNDFIADYNIWNEICVIRFQDVPKNDNFMEVKGYYYKKRIQIRVNNPKIISNFIHENDYLCM